MVIDGAGKEPDWRSTRWASGVAGKVLILELLVVVAEAFSLE